MFKGKKIIAAMVLSATFGVNAMALTEPEAKVQAEMLAEFLTLGRIAVAHSLAEFKINDTAKGDKGFTADIFAGKINEAFKASKKVDILAGTGGESLPAGTMDLLKKIMNASKKVVNDNLALINTQGLGFKGFIPASYGRQVGDIFAAETGITLKQTTDKLRNEYNKPDAFEKGIMEKMLKGEIKKDEVFFAKEGSDYRLTKPLYIVKGCLGCHGDPVGELDVAGRKKEGYKEGDLRGIISVKIPAK